MTQEKVLRDEMREEIEITVQDNIATVITHDKEELFKILYADREKLIRFRDIIINPDDLQSKPLENYRESSLWGYLYNALIKSLSDTFNKSNKSNLNIAEEEIV